MACGGTDRKPLNPWNRVCSIERIAEPPGDGRSGFRGGPKSEGLCCRSHPAGRADGSRKRPARPSVAFTRVEVFLLATVI
jgi:hypothetical protein